MSHSSEGMRSFLAALASHPQFQREMAAWQAWAAQFDQTTEGETEALSALDDGQTLEASVCPQCRQYCVGACLRCGENLG